MPANLPPEAKAKFVKYMEAKTPEEKLEALKEFIASVPKHKGTENLLYWARRRMAELREEIEERKRKRVGGGGPTFFIEKEGAAQVVLIGLPNSGKSSVLRRLTNARVTVSDVPYSTRLPVPGMLRYEDIQFQLVEAPSLIPGGGGWNSRVVGMAKNADAVALVIDASAGPLGQLRTVLRILRDGGVELRKPRGYVTIERLRGGAGIRVVVNGRLIGCTLDDIRRLLEGYRVYIGRDNRPTSFSLVTSYDREDYNRYIMGDDFDFVLSGWIIDSRDPDDFLTTIFGVGNVPEAFAHIWKDDEFGALVLKARGTVSLKSRWGLYNKAVELFYDASPWIMIASTSQIGAFRNSVYGFKFSPTGEIRLRGVKKVR